MKTFVIGDVHGMFRLYQAAWELIDAAGPCNVVFLGDYIDRGLQSAHVLEDIIQRRNQPNATFLAGNHEVMMLEALAYGGASMGMWQMNGGNQTLDSYLSLFGLQSIPSRHIDMLLSLPLKKQIGRWTFVHAGFDPTISFENQSDATLLWSRSTVGCKIAPLDRSVVVHGHTPNSAPLITNHYINIDTTAVFGGALTVLEIADTENTSVEKDNLTFHKIFVDPISHQIMKGKWHD